MYWKKKKPLRTEQKRSAFQEILMIKVFLAKVIRRKKMKEECGSKLTTITINDMSRDR